MIFESLHESMQKRELLLVDGGMCQFHLRRDGQLTIKVIISTRPGAGTEMLTYLIRTSKANRIVARCPQDLPANQFWRKRGFELVSTLPTKTGRQVNEWVLLLT